MTLKEKTAYVRIMQTIAMKRLYLSGQSISALAAASGRSQTTVRRYLRKAGVL